MISTEMKASARGLLTSDLHKIRKVGAPLLSPVGDDLVYHVSVADDVENDRYDLITLLLSDGTKTVLGRGTANCWSPDGTALFYETESGALQIHTLQPATSRFLTQRSDSTYFFNHLADKNCIWSPDGKYIAYVSADISTSEPENEAIRVIDNLLYKSKGGMGRPVYADHSYTHIYMMPAAGGSPVLLTAGTFNEHSITWSPDSSYIAFVSNRSARPDDTQQNDIWKIAIHTKTITRLTEHTGLAYQPTWSPDGKHIAFLAVSGAFGTNDSTAEDTHIALISASGENFRYLTKSFDHRVEHIRWHPSGKHIYFTAGDRGDTSIYQVSIDNEEVIMVQGGLGSIFEFCLDTKGVDLVFTKSDTNHPAELFKTKNHGADIEQITRENAHWLETKTLQQAETFWFESFDKTPVQGWLMPPVDYDQTQHYPLILLIHGGPHNMFGHDFDERVHLLSQAGYAVVYINPRGSHGYGQAFSNGTLANWGGGDYQDLMAGVDFVLNKNQWLNAQQMGVTGQSYGGYMTNWIITQTARFKAAVTDGGLSNLVSFAGTSLYHSLMESEFGGRAYENFDLLWQCSPLRNVAQATTPTLILHGETDNEVPFSQAEEMYVALRKRGVNTMLVQYKGEGHGWRPELKPHNKADLNERLIQWFDTYVKAIAT
ncbi:S9 family peptidase [Dyadobacter psychrophilus]|uniref:Dipeptidyl aminopeptidase/acylaminoacyl peptidase n=1 Tax=Dyadobacter psychrophilus TaxID=651661 RepID=A0A1T5DG70_9BACT|nr:S9 family peptidase [Dyadobacter psychrophilus]SKB70704.1 Dipeptidyl aminopeptidase/acylaminoacyl peptidase [Dyadobacter psychrophilus]